MRATLATVFVALLAACGTSTVNVGAAPAEALAIASSTSPGHDAGTDAGTVDVPPAADCVSGQTTECTTSCGSAGTRTCTDGRWASTCVPPAERCSNGVDDDCNGLVDSSDSSCWTCIPGQTRGCTGSCGSPGTTVCTPAGQWETVCRLRPEDCGNGVDDDCNGLTDGADPVCFECTPGQTRTCTTTCGSAGHESCTAGHWETTCHPPVETCGNGVDDDCNGLTDGADPTCWECTPGQTRSCTSSCGSTGTEACAANHYWEATCRPPVESCDNGVDDDCDGRVDHHDPDCTPVIHTCESAEGGGCNGDMGYGDHCSAADNTGGCAAGRFWAWCNRRNTALPNIWYDYVEGWVTSRCDGTTTDTGTQYDTWYCVSSTNDRYECTTPLVLAFDGARVSFGTSNASFEFTPGEPVTSAWPSAKTPWLVRDLDGNGRIDDGRELFGSNTRLPKGALAVNGFEALAALDDNHDGVVDARDAAFASLRLWSDTNADRRSDPGELRTLTSAGVTSLSVRFTIEPRCDGQGNCERERATFVWTDAAGAHTGAVVDVYLATRPAPRLVCAREP